MSDEFDCPTAIFVDERIALGNWQPRLEEIGVPTPETQPIPLDHDTDGMPEWDTQFAVEVVENLGGKAFVRSDFKSAIDIREGSYIPSADSETVDLTIAILLSNHAMMRMPLGNNVYLREWLDLDWDCYASDTKHPEVRAFVRDGDVVCHHPRLDWGDDVRAKKVIDDQWDEHVRPHAERVAQEFDGDGWHSVDFVLTRDGEWYCTDMALDALYDASTRPGDDDGWRNVSAHPGECPNDLEVMTEVDNA